MPEGDRTRSSTEGDLERVSRRKVTRVTAHYDQSRGLTFRKASGDDRGGPAYLVHEDGEAANLEVEVTVLGARLLKTFGSSSNLARSSLAWPLTSSTSSSRMEVYAVVDWFTADDRVEPEFARTPTDREGHTAPAWNHAIPRRPFRGADERIRLNVWEDSGRKPTLCGEAHASLEELLGVGASSATGSYVRNGAPPPPRELELELPGPARECTGSILVQAQLLNPQDASNEPSLTRVDPSLFEDEIRRLGVSGGTAPFFRLRLRQEAADGRSLDYYVGKDLSHAADEVLFYEKARSILMSPHADEGMKSLLSFMFEYAGVLSTDSRGDAAKDQDKPLDLLVMRNLHDGSRKLRLLDLKIGQKTGSAGWQGKSQTASMRQAVIDGVTNSSMEGFRLEGFDGAPASITTRDPLLDFGGGGGEKAQKKAFRIMLQRMTGAQVLMYFLDVHQEPSDLGEAGLSRWRSPSELAELVLREIVRQLAMLAAACRAAPVPQKWIGSSVALAFDCRTLPVRSASESEICAGVKVHIFDWGRSELNTQENHKRLSPEQRTDRATFWEYYAGGVDRLAWEAARLYWNRFCSEDWCEAVITLTDFDSHSSNEFIGRVLLRPLQEREETTVPLMNEAGAQVRGQGWTSKDATLTYSVKRRSYPEGSPLAGSWLITIIRADNLPRMNWAVGSTDAYAEIVATSSKGSRRFRQVSTVQQNTMNPVWEETFELPCAAAPDGLEAQLDQAVDGLGTGSLDMMFPCERAIITALGDPDDIHGPDDDHGFAEWTERLNCAASGVHRLPSEAPARRVACGQSVSIMEQGNTLVRMVALAVGAVVWVAAISWLCDWSVTWSLEREDVMNAACIFGQLILATCLSIFELSPRCLARPRCLDGFHNFLVFYASCFAKVKSRGLLHDMQGVLWLLEWVRIDRERPFLLAVACCEFFVGLLCFFTTCGLMPLRVVRKVHRVVVG